MRTWPLLLLGLGVAPQLARAQQSQPATQPVVETGDEGPIPDPNAPDAVRRRHAVPPGAERPRYTKSDYPTEIVLRPLTLPVGMGQLSLDVPFVAGDGDPTFTEVLRAGYGVTQDIEIGATYSLGLERPSAKTGEDKFTAGKALSLDGAYTIVPQLLAAQARLAFLFDSDHFGMGLILGVPVKLELGDRWALFGGQDLLHIKLKALPVDAADVAGNVAQLAALGRGVEGSRGSIDVKVGAAFQAEADIALYSIFGVAFPDFSNNEQPWSLFLGATYSSGRTFDLGARIGFEMLDKPKDSFSIAGYAAVRM
jgi:hypothetical protein